MSALAHGPGLAVDPFVGRTRELGLIVAAGRALRSGRGHVVVVSGEAGMGKSRLCAEAAERVGAAEGVGARVVTARCWLDGGAPPLWPWQSILADLGAARGPSLLTAGSGVDVGPDRFARFVAVTDLLAEVCATTPVCLVIDDVQGADYGALLLVRFVARSLSRFPLLLVLVRRDGEPAAGSDEARLLDEIEREAATSITLGGFDRAETAALLDAHGVGDLSPDLVATLHALSHGHPLHLRRIAQAVGASGAGPVPEGGVRAAIGQAFDSLGAAHRRLLAVAALLGPDPTVAEAAEVAGCDPVTLLAAVAEGSAVGLVTTTGDGRLSFGHELVRSVVEGGLTAPERLDAHARAAAAIAGDRSGREAHHLARAAHHARQAAARSRPDAELAVAACESAGRAMVRNFAYEQADELFSAAVDLHASARLGPPASLLVLQWAQAASLRGDMAAARCRYSVAIAGAEAEDRPGLRAEAVLGWGGVWLDDYPTTADKPRMLRWYRAALAALPADDPRYEPHRCRLRVRLAAEAAYAGGATTDLADLDEAVAAARASGDPRALAEALSLAQHALFTQEHIDARLPLADELVELTSHTDLGVLALMGLLWRTVNQLHAGDSQFLRTLEVLRERAGALGNRHMLYHVGVVDVLVAIGQGRLDDAEAQAERCCREGEQIGRVDAFAYCAAQLAAVRWLQGRDAELLDHVGEVTTSPVLADTEFSVWALAACLAARAGEHDRARGILRHHLPDDLADLVPSGTWLVGLVALVEAAAALADRDLARQAYDLLLPHADRPAVAGLGIVCLGSVERSLGLAAGVVDRTGDAVAHLERAVAANHRLVNRPLLAVARADLATALARRAQGDDRRRAASLLQRSMAEGSAMGLDGRVATWRRRLEELRAADETSGPPAVGPADDTAGRTTNGSTDGTAGRTTNRPIDRTIHDVVGDSTGVHGARRGVIGPDGRRWLLAVDGREVRVPNLVGMRYLAELLTNPGQRIPAVALTGQPADAGPPPRQEILDEQARATYAARARELAADLADAEADNDLHRAELLRTEIDLLVGQLEEATGLAGRSRHFPDDHERARVAVQKAIKRAVDAVDDVDTPLAELLRRTITTGVTCTYTPSTRAPVTWSRAG